MTQPVRLQLSRKRGFNLQAHSQTINGLEAVNVARPTKWANPYHGDGDYDHQWVVGLFKDHLARPEKSKFREAIRQNLRSRNLACWCKLDEACHADVLLEIANS